MKSTNMFQTARVLALPGVEACITLHPGNVSTRLRNAAADMLRSGVTVGTWASKAKKLADMVAAHFDVPMKNLYFSRTYVDLSDVNDEAVRAEVFKLYEVDMVSHLLSAEGAQFDPNAFKRWRRAERLQRVKDRVDGYTSLRFESAKRGNQAKALLIEFHRKRVTTDHRNQLAANFLMGDQPMELTNIPRNF